MNPKYKVLFLYHFHNQRGNSEMYFGSESYFVFQVFRFLYPLFFSSRICTQMEKKRGSAFNFFCLVFNKNFWAVEVYKPLHSSGLPIRSALMVDLWRRFPIQQQLQLVSFALSWHKQMGRGIRQGKLPCLGLRSCHRRGQAYWSGDCHKAWTVASSACQCPAHPQSSKTLERPHPGWTEYRWGEV